MLRYYYNLIRLNQRRILNPAQHLRWSFFAEMVNSYKLTQPLTEKLRKSERRKTLSQLLRNTGSFDRSSRPEVFRKRDVLKNFTKSARKHMCQSFFFNKVAVLKNRLWHGCFPVNLRKPFFYRTSLVAAFALTVMNLGTNELKQ